MKIAIAQLNPIIGDIKSNAQEILKVAQVASKRGVDLLLTPELSLCGYPPKDLLLNPSFVELMATELAQLARDLPFKLTVLVGTVEINDQAKIKGEKPLFNSIALLKDGKIQTIFHKRLLPNYDVFDEARYFESGKESDIFMINKTKIGVTICEDLWNDETFWKMRRYQVNPVADLASLGSQLIVNLSASPYILKKQNLRELMSCSLAKSYQVPLIYTNQIGGNDDLIFDGNSFATNRQGEVVGRAKSFVTDLLLLEFDENEKDLHLTNINPLPKTEETEIFAALVLGVKDYVKKSGFSQVVLGLSGGIDSALVAAIASEALGASNVLGVLMPSPYSSNHSIIDAEKLVENLGIKSYQLPIENIMKTYDQLLEPIFIDTVFGIAEENLQSRIRGNLLMAIANKFGYLLLSTGNKSEISVGYCTLYGDMNGGLAVIADIPKMRVFALCQWLNRDREIIPQNILTKLPSAELKPGQVDQDSLPPYEILDEILERLIQNHQSVGQIIAAGFEPETVQKVYKLVNRAEFKRKQAAPGLKVTDRAFGTGWRMPIASRW